MCHHVRYRFDEKGSEWIGFEAYQFATDARAIPVARVSRDQTSAA
jgi:hypothetical protein